MNDGGFKARQLTTSYHWELFAGKQFLYSRMKTAKLKRGGQDHVFGRRFSAKGHDGSVEKCTSPRTSQPS
ncbi:MAG: hypothetical protein KDA42_08600, partial [Planctomycetales bacterium]|nr:hypothetical protein [Planctomycetales bacterium]